MGGQQYVSNHNVIIQWIRYDDVNATKKASPIYITEFKDNDIKSDEVAKQLELLTK